MGWLNSIRQSDGTDGIVVYVLILVIIVQTIYPMTIGDTALSYVIYNILYAMLMISGVLVTRNSPRLMWVVLVLGTGWLCYGLALGYFITTGVAVADLGWLYLFAFFVIALFQSVVMQVLLTFVFSARVVTRDVLFAAIAVYWLLGGFFGSIFGILEALTFTFTGQNAFIDGTLSVTGTITPWQSTLYYSYATLTTLGYGDILPLTGWARSLASAEAIVGVMYTTIVMARLVGVYVTDADKQILEKDLHHAD